MIASDMFPLEFTLCLPLLLPTPLFYRPFPPRIYHGRNASTTRRIKISRPPRFTAPLPSSRFAKRKPPQRYAKKGDATRGLPRRSPILVLLSPKHALLRSSDGIRCFSAGMIASDMFPLEFTLCLPLLLPTPLFYRPFPPRIYHGRNASTTRRIKISRPPRFTAPLPSSRFAKRKPPQRYAKKGDATRGLPRRSPILV